MSTDDRITKLAPRGQHIPLTCKNHPELRWTTKNIERIGARSIFYSANWGVTDFTEWKEECDCPFSDLRVATEEFLLDTREI